VELDLTLGLVGYNNVDYNDLMVSATVTSAPEPGTLALLALGLLAVGAAARRRSISVAIG